MAKSWQFKTRVVRQAFEYWAGKAAGDRLPSRADIRPEEIPALLPYVYLVDVMYGPLSFRFRLAGTAIRDWAGREFTGVRINEQEYGPQWKHIFDQYQEVVLTRAPTYAEYHAPWAEREFLYYERVVAPLSSDGKIVDTLFGALHTVPRKRGGADPPAPDTRPAGWML
jgi:hypothetical protein